MTNSYEDELILIGGGGHAVSVSEVAHDLGYKIIGSVIPKNYEPSSFDIIDEDEFLTSLNEEYDASKNKVIIAIGTNKTCSKRRIVIDKFEGLVTFVSLISSKAILEESVKIGEGTVVMPSATIRINTVIGQHCIINTSCSVDHGCNLGDNCHVGPGAILCGEVKLGSNVFVGSGAIIFPGVTISERTTIPAGTTVKKSC